MMGLSKHFGIIFVDMGDVSVLALGLLAAKWIFCSAQMDQSLDFETNQISMDGYKKVKPITVDKNRNDERRAMHRK